MSKEMVEKFQCPGCVCGSDTTCGQYKPDQNSGGTCRGHVVGTMVGWQRIALGLPKGFCIPGWDSAYGEAQPFKARNVMNLRLWKSGTHPEWDDLNVPVWAMVKDGYLFVRTFQPRIDLTSIDVIQGGTLDLCPKAIDVSKFVDEIS